MKIFAAVAIVFISVIFLRKRLFLIPYFYLLGVITEQHGFFRVLSNLLGDYLSVAKLITGILFLAYLVAKKPNHNIDFKNNNLLKIVILVILYFSSTILWTDRITDMGSIISFPLMGLITYVFAKLCLDEVIQLHFIRALSLSGLLISFAALTIYFNIEFFNFLGGNYLNIDSLVLGQDVFRSRPLNINSNIASFWIVIGSVFSFSFYLNKNKMWDFLSSNALIYLLFFNIAGLLSMASLSSLSFFSAMLIMVLFQSKINQKIKIYFRILSLFILFFVLSLFTGLGENLINRFKENKFESVRADHFEDVSGFGGRKEIISNSFSYFARSPFIGHGFNSFKNEFGKSSHNSFLWALTSGGIVGFVLWLAFKLSLITSLKGSIDGNHIRNSIDISLKAVCIGFIIYSLAHNLHLNKFFWLIIALVIANVSRNKLAIN